MRDLDGLWDNAQQSHKLIALVRNMDNKKNGHFDFRNNLGFRGLQKIILNWGIIVIHII